MSVPRIPCPHCQADLRLGEPPRPGAKLKCPKCGGHFAIPVAVVEPSPALRDRDDDADEPDRPLRKKRRRPKPARHTALIVGLIAGIGLVGLVCTGVAAAYLWYPWEGQRNEDAVALLEKAIAASGMDKAPPHAARRWTGQGASIDLGERIPMRYECVLDADFRRGRWTNHTMDPDGAITTIQVLNGRRGWVRYDEDASSMDSDEVRDGQDLLYLNSVETLVRLRDKQFSLQLLPESSVQGRPALGLSVTLRGHPEVRLHFDRESTLLVKTACRRRIYGEMTTQEAYFSDHKFVQGVAVAMKELSYEDGTLASDLTYSDFQFLDDVDERLFQKP